MNRKTPKSKSKSPKKKAAKAQPATLPPNIIGQMKRMESVLADLNGSRRGRKSALDKAQDLIYEAWEAESRQRMVTLALKAIELSSDCADAYNLLAEQAAESVEQALEIYRKGVEAGERALGKETFKEDIGHFWGILETRPYMRARAGLAQCLWEVGQREEAIKHYWEILKLNPNDNQGMRDYLMPCLIELGRDVEAEKLFKQYREDGLAVWLYSRTLLDFRKHGASQVTDRSLAEALEENRHVPAYLLGQKKLPRSLPGFHGMGDDNEAMLYASENLAAWRASPGALEWLATKIK